MLSRVQYPTVLKETDLDSFQESKIDSIRRHFSKPFAWETRSGRKKDLRGRLSSERLALTNTMPKNSRRRDYAEDSTAAGNESDHSSHSRKVNEAEKESKEDQSSFINLQPYTNNLRETTRAIAVAQKLMQKLNDLYVEHMQEIEEVPGIHRQLTKLENECMHKNRRIHRQKQTIIELQSVNKESEFELEARRAKMQEAEQELEKQKQEQIRKAEKAEKSIQIQKVELQHEVEAQRTQMKTAMETELDRRKNEQDEQHNDRTKKLEDEQKKFEEEHSARTRQLEDEHSTRTKLLEDEHSARTKQLQDEHSALTKVLEEKISAREAVWENQIKGLEADNKRLSEDLEMKQKRIDELVGQLKSTKDDLDDMKEAKTAYKKQVENLEAQLDMLENEFGLTTKTTDFYKKTFAEIASVIEQISSQFFKDLPPTDDVEKIQRDLIAIDECFRSIPISDSDASQDLRVAYAQRTISTALYTNIWQPFSSEKALSYPNSASLLNEVYTKLTNSDLEGNMGREASVWKVLTMRALLSLDQDLPLSQTTCQEGSHSSHRARQAVNDILERLSPLIAPPQKDQIEEALLDIAKSAVDVWNVAQTDVLKLTACATLDPSERNTWRSARFDPAKDETDEMNFKSSTVFTLFPQVVAHTLPSPARPSLQIPGSASTPEQELAVIETRIYPGTGLPEWSELVLRGREEEEEKKAYLQEVIGQARKALAKGRTVRVSGMNASLCGPSSGYMSGSLSTPIVEIFQ